MTVEIFNQRSHEESSDQCTDARHQAGDGTDDNTDQIAGDADKAEGNFAFVGKDDGDGIINGNTQIGCHVQGGSKAHDQHCNGKKEHTDSKTWGGTEVSDHQTGKIDKISGQEHVYQCGNSHVGSGDEQIKNQHNSAQDHIVDTIGSDVLKKAAPNTLGKALEGIDSKEGALEKADGNRTKKDTEGGHSNTFLKMIRKFHGGILLIK